MIDRRAFLGAIALPPAAAGFRALAPQAKPWAAHRIAELAAHPGAPEDVAADEDFWFHVQEAFTADRSLINLNNGGVSPSPAPVQAALGRYLAHANTAPAHVMWRLQQPQKETVRAQLAGLLGCDAEEVAITRNASEGLETCQLGFDLAPGDEVLTTNQDYPRMITTFRQRERRGGIVLRQISIPVPAEDPGEIVRRFAGAITDRTRLILICHVINLTGQIVPVREIAALGRSRGIPVIVDGAHAFAHLDFEQKDLDCDYYATSLHKWLFAPFGTGLLYVRRDKIAGLWPMMAAPEELAGDVRKFEEIGTHSVPNILAIGEAVTFHQGIGPSRKLARLIHLRDRWAKRLAAQDRVRLHTSLAPGRASGLANVEVVGIGATELGDHLWNRHKILVTPIEHAEFQGVRVTPSVYTTLEELDRFCEAVEDVIAHGLPA